MRPEVKKKSKIQESETKERCFIMAVANDTGDDLVSIARARVLPGITTAWHRLNGTTERYIIASGHGCVEIDDLGPIDVSEGDIVRIPADTAQRITNTGKSDLIFYCICSPRFEGSYYESLE